MNRVIYRQIRVLRAQSSLTLNAFLPPEGYEGLGYKPSGFTHFFVSGCEFVTNFAFLMILHLAFSSSVASTLAVPSHYLFILISTFLSQFLMSSQQVIFLLPFSSLSYPLSSKELTLPEHYLEVDRRSKGAAVQCLVRNG